MRERESGGEGEGACVGTLKKSGGGKASGSKQHEDTAAGEVLHAHAEGGKHVSFCWQKDRGP